MSDFRTVKTLRTERDDCATCKHARVELVPGANHLLCTQPDVREAFDGRERVATALARGTVCAGRLHPAHPAAQGGA